MAKRMLIIGGGPGGYVCAIRAAQLGAEVMVVEKNSVGGTCLNRGCVPTKTLLHAARLYRGLQNTRAFGVFCTPGPLRFDKMVENKDVVVRNNVSGVEDLLRRHRITLTKGTARLLDPETVEIEAENGRLTKERPDAVIVATGSEPLVPDFIMLDGERIITTTEALNLDHVPSRIAIVGGSVAGCEFACLFALLGSRVTLVEMLDRLVPTEDAEISRRLEGGLRRLGVAVMTKTVIEKTRREYPRGSVRLATADDREIEADYCLLTIGRKLNTENIGLERAGVVFSSKGVAVNERMETNVKNIYAIGDVTGKNLLAHVASEQGIVAAENVMGIDSRMDYSAVPSFIYTDPEIGSVGMKEQEAREIGSDVVMGKVSFKTNAMAHAIGNTTGFVKVIVERETQRVLGVHILGPHATDLLGEAVTIVKAGMTVEGMKGIIHPHPTLSETIKEAVLASAHQAIHG